MTPDARTHTHSFAMRQPAISAAQRVTQISSSWSDATHPAVLAHNITYTPWGALATLQNGCAGSGCTEALETYVYNNRLQVSQMELGKSGSPAADFTLGYNYTWPSGALNLTGCPLQSQPSANNGNVIGYTYTDAVNNYAMSHSALYVYDNVNRLACAQATSPNNNPTATYNLAFNYTADGSNGRYGNMTCVSNQYTNGNCHPVTFASAPVTNRIDTTSGYIYDAAGNVTTNGAVYPLQTYQWDAEGRVASVNSGALWNFTYNALGQRVLWTYQHGTPTDAWYDPQGTSLGMAGQWNLVGFFGHWTLYIGGDTWFSHPNPLGSDTMRTDHFGFVLEDMTFYPWGDVWLRQGAAGFNFAGIPYYDQPTNTSIAAARFYANNMGQWLSPDPAAMKAARLDDPQTWNMYAYARNNPTTLTDPTGLYDVACQSDAKTCTKAQQRFDKKLQKDLNSRDEDKRAAAAAYGKFGDMGMTVTFAPEQQVHTDAVNPNVDAFTQPGIPTKDNPAPSPTAEFSFGLSGSDLDRAIVHEGTHLGDMNVFLQTYDPATGTFLRSANPVRANTEISAYGVGEKVKPYPMFPAGPGGYPQLMNWVNTHIVDPTGVVFPPSMYPQRADFDE